MEYVPSFVELVMMAMLCVYKNTTFEWKAIRINCKMSPSKRLSGNIFLLISCEGKPFFWKLTLPDSLRILFLRHLSSRSGITKSILLFLTTDEFLCSIPAINPNVKSMKDQYIFEQSIKMIKKWISQF